MDIERLAICPTCSREKDAPVQVDPEKAHCTRCGSKPVRNCPGCKMPITRYVDRSGYGGPPEPVPDHCQHCGAAFSWARGYEQDAALAQGGPREAADPATEAGRASSAGGAPGRPFLEMEQEDLLRRLINAGRSVPREARTDFTYSPAATRRGARPRAALEKAIDEGQGILYHFFGISEPITKKEAIPYNHDHDLIYHPGLPDGQIETHQSDMDALSIQDLIHFRSEEHFFVTPSGMRLSLRGVSHVNERDTADAWSQEEGHPSEKDDAVDFAIVTAIKVEREAVCSALGFTDADRVFKGSRVYWRGRLPLPDGASYGVVVAQCSDMGNVEAAVLTTDTLHHWQPRAVLLVGIAGAASKEQRVGDVVVARDVYYYERGKQGPDGLRPELKVIPSDALLWSRFQALPPWKPDIPVLRPGGGGALPILREGVIASGEKVIADAAVRDQIASRDRKTQAIEMEGYGFSRAIWQSVERVSHLVIRGICDDASARKNSRWHPYAAAAAADFARHFLLDGPLEPSNPTRKKKR